MVGGTDLFNTDIYMFNRELINPADWQNILPHIFMPVIESVLLS